MLDDVTFRACAKTILLFAPFLAFTATACHKEEQAVVGVAQNAAKAERQAQATATERDSQRAQLEQIPLPTKSLYIDIHDPAAWANPFLIVGPETITLSVPQPNAASGAAAQPTTTAQPTTALKPAAARRQEMQLRPEDLAKAVIAIPHGAWRYGRVIAVAESPSAASKDRPMVRRNVEAAVQQLNDLGIVVQEWPAR
jgi:type II secretory pathway pseudopilin PulG